MIRDFDPPYLVVSVGFDTLGGDLVGSLSLTMDGLAEISARIAALGIPTIIVQEGGYLVPQLGKAAVAFLSAWLNEAVV